MHNQNSGDVTEMLMNRLVSTKDNEEFSENIIKFFGKKTEEK
jgi:hypothetical protein